MKKFIGAVLSFGVLVSAVTGSYAVSMQNAQEEDKLVELRLNASLSSEELTKLGIYGGFMEAYF
jgi:hypothetical protein